MTRPAPSLDFPPASGAALPPFDEASCAWHAEQRAGGRLLLRMGRQGPLHVAQDTRYGTLLATADGASYRFDALADADPLLVAKFVASVVRALVRQLQGKLSLHGSVVAFEGRAVAFVGGAFAGKSTLAHACVHHARAALLADDTVAFVPGAPEPTVEPVQRGTWLLEESRAHFGLAPSAERKVLAEHPVSAAPCPLRAVVLLEALPEGGAEEERLLRVRGVEAFRLLSPHVFRFAERDPALHRRELDSLADLAPRLAVYVLRRAKRFDRLEAQVALVRAALDGASHADVTA
jgi:hypothetical protein